MHLTRVGISDPDVTKTLTCWRVISVESALVSESETEESTSLFSSKHSFRNARAAIIER